MRYHVLEPEVAGGFGGGTVMDRAVHPPEVNSLNFEFDGWLGDVLLESFPCFIATTDAVRELQKLSATGVQFNDFRITKSVQFQNIYPDRVLPKFRWLKVFGRAGVDDLGLASDSRLVVSDRVLNVLKPLGISNALIQDFEP